MRQRRLQHRRLYGIAPVKQDRFIEIKKYPKIFRYPMSDVNEVSDTVSHVVLLVHGIRDLGGWQEDAKRMLERDSTVRAIPVKFGWYDVLSFLAPTAVSRNSFEVLLRNYEEARENYRNARISVIAHSYGSYLVGQLLVKNPKARFSRIILCGSVLDRDFSWGDVRDCFGDGVDFRAKKCVLNECGSTDFWPVIADICRERYGAAGRHGLDATFVENVWFAGGHDLFFKLSHMRDVWCRFIIHGELPDGNSKPPDASLIEKLACTLPGFPFICRSVLTLAWFILKFWYFAILTLVIFSFILPQLLPNQVGPGSPEEVHIPDPLSLFTSVPTPETVQADQPHYVSDFVFKYRNLGDCNCKILLYDFTSHFSGQSIWREIGAPANTKEFKEYRRFFSGAGWFGIAVETSTGERIPVETVNFTTFGKSSLTIFGDCDDIRTEWAD